MNNIFIEVPSFAQILDFVGSFAFAISGIRLASGRKFDVFGAYVVGLTTAVGGGTSVETNAILDGYSCLSYMHRACSAVGGGIR